MINFGQRRQLSGVRRLKVLYINGIGPDHIPRTIQHECKRLGGREVTWFAIVKKGERKARDAARAEEDTSMAFLRGICHLPRESGNLIGGWNVPTPSVDAKLPMMEGTLDRLSGDGPLAQVRAHMDTLGIQHGDIRTLRAEGYQLST